MSGVVGRIALAEARHTLTGLPKWLYIGIGIIAAVLLLLWWDASRIKAAEKRGASAENVRWQTAQQEAERKARDIAQRAEQLARDINEHVRIDNEKALGDIRSRANALRLRGPGAAATCPSSGTDLPEFSGRAVAGSQAGPFNGGLARVPYPPLVDFAENHDSCFASLTRWEQAWKQHKQAWPKPKIVENRP